MGRVKVYDAENIARNLRETFTDKPVREMRRFPFTWPSAMQNVGDSLSIAYSSDKWKEDGDLELYKHLAESRNYAFCKQGLLVDRNDPNSKWRTIGPLVSFEDLPLPKHFAILAYFEEAQFQLYTEGTDEEPEFGRGKDSGVVQVRVGHALLGGSKLLWSEVSDREDQPFLFVYTEKDGPLILIIGEELDILADGIVG